MAHPFPALDGSAPTTQKFDQAPEFGIDTSKRYTATVAVHEGDAPMGTLVIALDAVNAPNTVTTSCSCGFTTTTASSSIASLVSCARRRSHRNRPVPGYKFNDEPVKQRYQLGSLAMANAGPKRTAASSF